MSAVDSIAHCSEHGSEGSDYWGPPPPPPPLIELLNVRNIHGGLCRTYVIGYLDINSQRYASLSCTYLRDAVADFRSEEYQTADITSSRPTNNDDMSGEPRSASLQVDRLLDLHDGAGDLPLAPGMAEANRNVTDITKTLPYSSPVLQDDIADLPLLPGMAEEALKQNSNVVGIEDIIDDSGPRTFVFEDTMPVRKKLLLPNNITSEAPVGIEYAPEQDRYEPTSPDIIEEELIANPDVADVEEISLTTEDATAPSATIQIPEAFLVTNQGESSQEAFLAVEAERLDPLWKQRRVRIAVLTVLIAFVSMAIALGVSFGGRTSSPSNTSQGQPSPTINSSQVLAESCLTPVGETDGAFFGEDCAEYCGPVFGINNETLVVSRDFTDIQMFEYGDNDSIELLVQFDFEGQVGDINVVDDVVAVAAFYNDSRGAVQLYERDSFGVWNKTALIDPEELGDNDWFAWTISMDQTNRLAVGALGAQSVYIYQRQDKDDEWAVEAIITPDDSHTQRFGWSLSLVGDLLVVGDWEYGLSDGWGAVFVYQYQKDSQSWTQIDFIKGSDETCGAPGRFGASAVLIDGGEGLIVGCNVEYSNAGAAYYYKRNETSLEYNLKQEIKASDESPNNYFASTMKIRVVGDTMVIGTWMESGGKLYLFKRDKSTDLWTEVTKVYGPSEDTEYYSDIIKISDKFLLSSSWTNVYVYRHDEC